jgi:predicted nucleotidyltransferase/HEPN domain-containing protein
MKQSLDHLSSRKQAHLRDIVQLIRDVVDVEMIVLFGSHARGDHVDDPAGGYVSDYDILIVVDSKAKVEDIGVWQSIESKASRRTGRHHVTLIVHDIDDVNHQLEQGWYFFSDVKKEGIVLFDSGRHVLAEAKPKTMAQRRMYAQQCFQRYFARAAQFFSIGVTTIKHGWNEIAAFQLHQATETYYKCAILVLTAYWPKQHNIATLGSQCAGLSPAFRDIFPLATEDDERRFELLKEAYVKARYSLTYTISRDDLEALARHIAVLHERTEAACKEYIASMQSPPEPS